MTRRELVCTVILGVVLAAAVLRPALTDLGGSIPGVRDSEQVCGTWVQRGAQEAIWEHHEFPTVYRNTAYPEGGRLYPLFLVNVLLTLPLYPLLDSPGVHSLSLALSVALAFIFAVMLFRQLSGSWWAALPGALLFTLSPYMISHLIYGPAESTTYAWILPAVLAAERLAAGERLRPGLAALTGLLVAVCFANSIYSGMFAAVVVLFSLFTREISLGSLGRRGAQAGLAMVVAAALIAPMAMAIRDTMSHPRSLTPDRIERIDNRWHASLLDDWTVQDAANFVWPSDRFHGSRYQPVMYLGLVAVLATIVAMIRVRAARRWGWLAAGGVVFCLGGTLRLMGATPELFGAPVRLPAGLLCRLPVLDAISHPFRFLPVVLMAMGAAIALLLASVKEETSMRRRGLSLLLSVLIVGDLGMMYAAGPFQLPVMEVKIPEFYEGIRKDPGDYAVLDVPVGASTKTICSYYLYQHEHRKLVPYSLLGINFESGTAPRDFTDALVLPNEMEFGDARQTGHFGCSIETCDGAEELQEMGLRYLVLHRTGVPTLDEPLQECVERCLPSLVHEDELVRVYEFQAPPSQRGRLRHMTGTPTSTAAPRP